MKHIVKSLSLVIITTISSFLIILIGKLVLIIFLLIIWIIIIYHSFIINVILIKEYEENHILNYIFLFSLLATLIGSIFVDLNRNYNEKELFKIASKIEDYYADDNREYNDGEIKKILYGHNKFNPYDINVENDSYTISVHLRFAGGIYRMIYNSRNKIIYNEYYENVLF
jgi:hypothetical protein